jgi:hypothetical protein
VITPKEFRTLSTLISATIADLIENECFTPFSFSKYPPVNPGQFYECVFNCGDDLVENDETCVQRSVGYFIDPTQRSNDELNINQFFANNDRIVTEFIALVNQRVLDSLRPLLNRAKDSMSSQDGVSLDIFSRINGGSEWRQNVCDEYVLIIHLSEESNNTIHIGCQQNERRRIRIANPSTNEVTFLVIPYDKVACFNGAEEV